MNRERPPGERPSEGMRVESPSRRRVRRPRHERQPAQPPETDTEAAVGSETATSPEEDQGLETPSLSEQEQRALELQRVCMEYDRVLAGLQAWLSQPTKIGRQRLLRRNVFGLGPDQDVIRLAKLADIRAQYTENSPKSELGRHEARLFAEYHNRLAELDQLRMLERALKKASQET